MSTLFLNEPSTNAVLGLLLNTIARNGSPFPIGTDPEFWVDLVIGDELASQDMSS